MPTCEAHATEAVVRPPKPAPQFKVGDKVYLDAIEPSAPFIAKGGLTISDVRIHWVEEEVYDYDDDGTPRTTPGFWSWDYIAKDTRGRKLDGPFILQSEATPQHMLQEKINTGQLDLWDGPEERAKTKAAYDEWVAAGRPATDFTRGIFD